MAERVKIAKIAIATNTIYLPLQRQARYCCMDPLLDSSYQGANLCQDVPLADSGLNHIHSYIGLDTGILEDGPEKEFNKGLRFSGELKIL